jgi:DNA-3-methyladenine glycosylase
MGHALDRPAVQAAPGLLGALVTSRLDGLVVVARIVEVEAYGGADDPASHAYRGRTTRNSSMFGEPGTAYVYFTYGMHWCLNVAVGPVGEGAAVLLRAAEVLDGVDVATARRSDGGRGPRHVDLARGPARLCRALGVTGAQDGLDLLASDALRLELPTEPVAGYRTGPRVGVSSAADRPWRFWLPDEPCVSAYRGARAPRRERGQG